MVPFISCVACLMIEVNGTSGKHHNLLCNFVLEENVNEFAYIVRAPKPHDAKRQVGDRIDQACPKGGWIHIMHIEEPGDGFIPCHLSLLTTAIGANAQGTLLLAAPEVRQCGVCQHVLYGKELAVEAACDRVCVKFTSLSKRSKMDAKPFFCACLSCCFAFSSASPSSDCDPLLVL